MRDRVCIDTHKRRVFETAIKGVAPCVLSQVLDGQNVLGWWRSMHIRGAWKRLVGKSDSEYQEMVRQQYCSSC